MSIGHAIIRRVAERDDDVVFDLHRSDHCEPPPPVSSNTHMHTHSSVSKLPRDRRMSLTRITQLMSNSVKDGSNGSGTSLSWTEDQETELQEAVHTTQMLCDALQEKWRECEASIHELRRNQRPVKITDTQAQKHTPRLTYLLHKLHKCTMFQPRPLVILSQVLYRLVGTITMCQVSAYAHTTHNLTHSNASTYSRII